MSLEYSKAKNQSEICKWNSFYLHSTYNPETEAERFVNSLTIPFVPENIIILEPALSYCVPFLRIKFPSSKIYCIRFINDIKKTTLFEKEFLYSSENPESLTTTLFNYFGETGLLSSFFISWPPSSKAFSDYDKNVWKLVKNLLKDCQNILATRQFFSKRWIKNQINFLQNLKSVCSLKQTDLPILVCASGPSLNNSLKYIKLLQNNFFIIACSSAIKALLENNIIPDLCITTDGGYWAKKHLNCLENIDHEIKIALPSEANISKTLLSNHNIKIVPLAYCDNFDNFIYDNYKIPYIKAFRNGTISGTAVELALTLTSTNVFICGVDLEASKGFVHTQPNELELENSQKDNRLNTIDKRTFAQGRDSVQLELYRNWFISKSYEFSNRVYRVSDNHTFMNSLGRIIDINFNDLSNLYNHFKVKNMNNFFTECINVHIKKQDIVSIFKKLITDYKWKQNYFPADCLMLKRVENTDKYHEYLNRLNDKIEDIENFLVKMES